MGAKTLYSTLGVRLTELRCAAGIARQSDFAKRIKTKQQTVSRWEAGMSRPREKQLPEIAAALLAPGANVDDLIQELRIAAGYTVKTVIVSFDQPFPTDALMPEVFERFNAHLLMRLYPKAEVHRAGSAGHAQSGTDIQVKMEDGKIHSFQCKRTEEFGPQKVHEAVAKHSVKAQKKYLLLSRTASPQAREAISEHQGWDIWDKDDLSAKIRSLSKYDQIALVDIFFAGRRFELLGETEEGVWERLKEFFAAFENASGLFNHTWSLVGRENALAELSTHLNDQEACVVLLIGAGGSGKSRVLKQAIEQFEAEHKGSNVYFLSRTAEVTKKSLEELGSAPALLIVDDAHDRGDLPLLFQFAATMEGIKLMLALRPYGAEHVKAQAASFALVDATREVSLQPLTKKQAEELAKQVLARESGPLKAAADIAMLTYDCPLATVVGAQVVAREKKHFNLATNEAAFRTTLFSRFESVVAGEIGKKADAEPLKKLLRVLSLFQPFYSDDKALLTLVHKLEGIESHDASRLIKLLIESGVLFKRGARYRLSPDVLGDYIIESACVGAEGKSTEYAEKAFDAADERLVQPLLLNLGKLDWRLSNGDASNSNLLDGVWAKLNPNSEYADPCIRAVEAIAFYQPSRAIAFVEKLIRDEKFLNQLPEILRNAAYNFEYVDRACAALWHLAKNDTRPTNPHPHHPIRVLNELSEVRPNKPIDYNGAVIDFGLAIATNPAEWTGIYTPLDFLSGIFKTEGHTTTSHKATLSFKPFMVTPKVVAKLRERVLDLVFELLRDQNPRVSSRAAQALQESLHYPIGLFNAKVSPSLREEWTELFCQTLIRIESVVKSNTYDPLVLVGIAKAVSWHALYSKSETKLYAQKIRAALSQSLDYRTLTAFVDGYGHELRRIDPGNFEEDLKKYYDKLARDIVAAHPSGEDLRRYLDSLLDHIQMASQDVSSSPYVLYGNLLRASPNLAEATVLDALNNPLSHTARFTADALLVLWLKDKAEGRKMAAAFLREGNEKLAPYVGRAVGALNFQLSEYGKPEVEFVERLVTSKNETAISSGIGAIRSIARGDVDRALKLSRAVNVASSSRLADELLGQFAFGHELSLSKLDKADIELLLGKLSDVPKLEGHWIETFLAHASKSFPKETLDFFKQRVDVAAGQNNWKYRPINHGPYVHVPLRFRETPDYGSLLAETMNWIATAKYEKEKRVLFKHRSRELFEAVFGSFDEEVIGFISRWSDTANEAGFDVIASILHEAPNNFVFSQQPLVTSILVKAKRVSAEAYKSITSALFASAVGGMREGIAGEPFPRDLETKEKSESILVRLSKFSPAYELYDGLLQHSDAEIKRALKRREEFEED